LETPGLQYTTHAIAKQTTHLVLFN